MYLLPRRIPWVTLFGVWASICADAHAEEEPLIHAHSHNDYWRDRPLLDALDRGFTSVEADVFLVAGELLVGHARSELSANRTLESLYLEPLARRVRENGGVVYSSEPRFILLIDIKTEAEETYRRLDGILAKYAAMLTTVEDGRLCPAAVTVVISGNRPTATMQKAMRRYAAIDGRLSDLEGDAPSHLIPLISDAWPAHFTWRGEGPMPPAEKAKLQEIVKTAHRANRLVRFWATPENETVWRELRTAGVDLIGTDQLDRLARFLTADGKPNHRADKR